MRKREAYVVGPIRTSSINITSSNVSAAVGNPAVICFSNLPFVPRAVSVTPGASYGSAALNRVIVSGAVHSIAAGCPMSQAPDLYHSAYITGWNIFSNQPAEGSEPFGSSSTDDST